MRSPQEPAGPREAAPLTAQLATRLRIEREARGWSLADLSVRSGVSRAMINKVERGESSPTAALLGRLSGAFGLTVSTLLARAEAQGAGRLLRAGDQPEWTDPETGYVRRQVYTARGADLPLDLVRIELPPRKLVRYPKTAFSFIRQVIWVLDGTLTFVEGADATRLGAGDCLELGPPSVCAFRNDSSDTSAVYLVAVMRL